MANETLDLAIELLRRKSLTPDDAGCHDLIAARLQALGFHIERHRHNGVDNLWARRGHTAPLVCFAGHTDVVPTGPLERWQSDPFEPTLRDGQLYARGAADMKTSVAAFVTATERFVAAHPDHPGSLAFLLTSDEEGPATDGTVRVVETLKARGEFLDFCIIGEPTSAAEFGDTIKNGRRGSLSGKLTIKGVQGHIAYPHLAKNPIHLAAPAIAELADTMWDEGNAWFPATTWQISNIHAGTGANNVIPGTLVIDFNFRFSTASTAEGLMDALQEILNSHGLDFEIVWSLSGRPFLTPRGVLCERLSDAIHEVTGVTPELSTTGGTSDGRFIADICPQVVEFGPLNMSIHKINEHVAVENIEPLAAIYQKTLEKLLT
ncbi:MAG: succinyl-diaminopimelate desuccinylase [Thiobacillus sp.]|nr:succinyl-diaminopimelate desuccinylase [Gammaproteobacteria bacterium]MDO9009321.1 succinyl-diaminopimelate desuccinylase [Thiobacillus sp.]